MPRGTPTRRGWRLGLTARLAILICAGLVALQAAMTVAYVRERADAVDARHWAPYPDQLEAMVALFNAADDQERALLRRALSDGGMLLSIEEEQPPVDGAAGDLAVDRMAGRIRRISEVLRGREVHVAIPAEQATGVFPHLAALMDPDMLRFSIRLDDGRWLVMQRQGSAALTLGGLPIGQFSGVLAALLAGGVVLWVRRETRPLRRLEEAASGFAADLSPRPTPPSGAPDLRALIEAFNAMQERIARLDRSRTDMIAAIAHDVRTPLTRLRLRLRKLPEELQDAAARDIDEIARISEEATRFAAADLAALEERVDFRQILRRFAGREGLSVETPDAPVLLRGAGALLDRAAANLIGNALHYGTRCAARLETRERAALLIVDDDGPGIAEADRERMMQPFARGDASRSRSTGGVGLGLALAARIAQRHGGRLELSVSPMGGLRAVMALPLAGECREG